MLKSRLYYKLKEAYDIGYENGQLQALNELGVDLTKNPKIDLYITQIVNCARVMDSKLATVFKKLKVQYPGFDKIDSKTLKRLMDAFDKASEQDKSAIKGQLSFALARITDTPVIANSLGKAL